MKKICFLLSLLSFGVLFGQSDRWQQRAEYTMDIDFDVTKNQFLGKQRLIYKNNSPDELDKVFYHLYFNAFQPGSAMDIRNQQLPDRDSRLVKIATMKPEDQGYLKIKKLTCNGRDVKFKEENTILEVELNEPIKGQSAVVFEMEFEGQVPLQTRRSGRDNAEGIRYSMTQWYPKMCEYDYQGWHADPYIGREFYGVWGDFDVTIHIDKSYLVAASGYLENPKEIGYGYTENGADAAPTSNAKLSWRFVATNVHDFAWAADPDYVHVQKRADEGTQMHFFYQVNDQTKAWKELPAIMAKAFRFIEVTYGKYPYSQYAFIQGGDGGMEYPMATLVTGNRSLPSLVGVSVHELMHAWFYGALGTNEGLYPWMDEGFTSYASEIVMNYLKSEGLLGELQVDPDPFKGESDSYLNFAKSGMDEPLTTHSDHYNTGTAYGVGAYTKGMLFLNELSYVIGKEAFDKGMLDYFRTWKFRHPNPNDFIRVMEKNAGLELDWFKEYFVQTTYLPDYSIVSVDKGKGKHSLVTLKRIGKMPMPIDLLVTYDDGEQELYYIPLDIMRGEKAEETPGQTRIILEDWMWVDPNYTVTLPERVRKIKSVEIDPSQRMLDTDKTNNSWNDK